MDALRRRPTRQGLDKYSARPDQDGATASSTRRSAARRRSKPPSRCWPGARRTTRCWIGERVGKTAIVEGLAQRMVAGEVPETLRDKRPVELNINAMVAGAKYRGEFEESACRRC